MSGQTKPYRFERRKGGGFQIIENETGYVVEEVSGTIHPRDALNQWQNKEKAFGGFTPFFMRTRNYEIPGQPEPQE